MEDYLGLIEMGLVLAFVVIVGFIELRGLARLKREREQQKSDDHS